MLASIGAVCALAVPLASSSAAPATNRCLVPGFGKPLGKLWQPHMKAAVRYAKRRTGDIAFAVRTENNHYGYRPNHQEWSASMMKAMLLVAYVDQPGAAHRKLTAGEKAILGPMITASNNYDAQLIYNQIGNSGLQALAPSTRIRDAARAVPEQAIGRESESRGHLFQQVLR